jgi:hypothetical protein
MKEDEMGGECVMHGGTRNAYQFQSGNQKGRDCLGDLVIDKKVKK